MNKRIKKKLNKRKGFRTYKKYEEAIAYQRTLQELTPKLIAMGAKLLRTNFILPW